MIKIIAIIGARPQIIKAAAISRAVKNAYAGQIKEVIIHTGQHYDDNMSKVFFQELGIPLPDYYLGVGSNSHGRQTALMIEGIEKILLDEKPDYLLVYGDTNSTLAGAVAASKLDIPVVHVEAGLRSFNKRMPEEINRIVCDHVSTLLFTPTETGYKNLLNEGFHENNSTRTDIDHPAIYHCGDVMLDNSLYFSELADKTSTVLKDNNLQESGYILATIHRANNTDDPQRLSAIFEALHEISLKHTLTVVMPLHPRTSGLLEKSLPKELYSEVFNNPHFRIIPPVSFLDMIQLEKQALMIITDSGGVQKEAYFFGKPSVIARAETEWTEIIDADAGIIADANKQQIMYAMEYYLTGPSIEFKPVFGDGKAAEFICSKLLEHSERQ